MTGEPGPSIPALNAAKERNFDAVGAGSRIYALCERFVRDDEIVGAQPPGLPDLAAAAAASSWALV